MTLLLELNDAALTLYRDGSPVYQTPAVALLDDRGIIFGNAALAQARIQPRQINQHYLARLNTDPLPTRSRLAKSHADLVYLHLRELARHVDAPLIVATPAVYSTDQLGILLGILEQAALRVAGFVDSAVAAGSLTPVPGSAWHVDVLLQRAVLTRLDLAEGQLARGAVEELPDCGLARLIDIGVDAVAGHFVLETRFDPLHAAAAEQQLYVETLRNVADDEPMGPHYLSGVGSLQPHHHPDKCSLARPVWANQRQYFTRGHVKINAVQYLPTRSRKSDAARAQKDAGKCRISRLERCVPMIMVVMMLMGMRMPPALIGRT